MCSSRAAWRKLDIGRSHTHVIRAAIFHELLDSDRVSSAAIDSALSAACNGTMKPILEPGQDDPHFAQWIISHVQHHSFRFQVPHGVKQFTQFGRGGFFVAGDGMIASVLVGDV